MSALRLFLTSVAAAGLLTAASQIAAAQTAACPGRNLLDDLKQTDAAAFDKLRKSADATLHGKSILWRIEHPTIEQRVSYLLGTIHVTDERIAKFSPTLQAAFDGVQRVVVEVADANVSRLTEGMHTLGDAGKLLLPGPDRLEKLLTPAELQFATNTLKHSGLSADMAARVQPWAVMAMAMPDCERSRIKAGRLPLDGEIARRAEARGVGTADIETVEMQFDAMARIPQAEQLSLLKGQVAQSGRIHDIMETMIQLYLARDVGALWPLQVALAEKAGVDAKATDAYRDNIIAGRTARMALRLHTHVERGGVFIAVGAMHLPGQMGLVQQFMDMGYKVTAVE